MSAAALPLPDDPRWVEAHDLAGAPDSWRQDLGAGGCIGSSGTLDPVICVWGDAAPAAVVAVATAHPAHTLLVARERQEIVDALAAAGRTVLRAILHTLPAPDALPDLDGAAPLPGDASLEHLPATLRTELEDARGRGVTIWAAWVDEQPVSFAYPSSRSEKWFDISVDTAPGYRQLGLGTIVAAAMIHAERAHGREPVWGALDDNRASLALAERLGFVATDELWVVPP